MPTVSWAELRWKVARLILLIASVLAFGTLGYHWIMGWDWLHAAFMAAITITTVGYGEVHPLDPVGRIFTIVLLFTSVGVFAYALSSLTSLIVEAQVGQL